MALIKLKPTSPGTRAVVRVVTPELHKGKPEASLLEKKTRTAGRNHNGHITTRHMGGGHKKHYRLVDFKRDKDRVSRPRSSVWNTTRTVLRTWRCWCMQTASVATSSLPRVFPRVRS